MVWELDEISIRGNRLDVRSLQLIYIQQTNYSRDFNFFLIPTLNSE